MLCYARILDFCLSNVIEKKAGRDEHRDVQNVNKYRSTLQDGFVKMASEICLAKSMFVNDTVGKKLLEILSWANQNDGRIIKQVHFKYTDID